MRILLTCDPEIPVPPKLYGGVERIVNGLAKGYTEEGHSVFLIANPASLCSYTIQNFFWPATSSRGLGNVFKNMRYLNDVVKNIRPDVIHSFSRLLYGYPLFLTKKIPFVQTYGRKISPYSTGLASRIAGDKLYFTSCASHMIKNLPNRHAFTPVFNFTDINYYTISNNFEERVYLMFLGRIEDIKGTKEAIQAAIQTNNKIIVAGNIQNGHHEYFERNIRPLLSHPLVEYIGEVNDEQKKFYLQRSKALLFPIKWEEPFGIVLAEALACGTPVIAFNRGAVPEIISDGINGYIVSNIQEMVDRIYKLNLLNNNQIREDAIDRFSPQIITKQYLNLFADRLKAI